MKTFREITPETLRENPFKLIYRNKMLITAGNQSGANTMTASWGGLGVMYGRHVAFIVVRPSRYTKEFIDREETFSLSFLDEGYKDVLNYLGTVSGRDEDKIAKSGLTLEYAEDTPYFNEAVYVLICRKLFVQSMAGGSLLDERYRNKYYAENDYHTLYIAEITRALQAIKKP